MSLKDSWKEAGKGIGKSFVGLGKSIIKSVEVGADRALDEEPKNASEAQPVDLRETWSVVGHSFGDAGKALGKAVAGTAKTVIDKVEADDASAQAAEQTPPQDPVEEKPAE